MKAVPLDAKMAAMMAEWKVVWKVELLVVR